MNNNIGSGSSGFGDVDIVGQSDSHSLQSQSRSQWSGAGDNSMSMSSTMTFGSGAVPTGEGDRNRLRRRNYSHESGMTRRCVCNLSQCASSNYMCKSERRILKDGSESEAGCFIEELVDMAGGSESAAAGSPGGQHGVGVTESNGRVTSARRGCIEMLAQEKQDMCSDAAGAPIQCCHKDMCNYPKTYYPPFAQSVNNNNKPLSFDSPGAGVQGFSPNLDHQVWLRAAVIAVPVCGLMILIALIIVARRLLKSDDADYKQNSGLGRSPRNNKTYNNYPSPHLSHQHVKPVFLEPQEFLLPAAENRCCCHNGSGGLPGTAAEYAALAAVVPGGFPQNPSIHSGAETDELVSNVGQLSHCQCPSNLSESGSYGINPYRGSPTLPPYPHPMTPKKFDLLAHFGLRRTPKEPNTNSTNNPRLHDV